MRVIVNAQNILKERQKEREGGIRVNIRIFIHKHNNEYHSTQRGDGRISHSRKECIAQVSRFACYQQK